jgi:hypothetical protein
MKDVLVESTWLENVWIEDVNDVHPINFYKVEVCRMVKVPILRRKY